MSHRRLAKVAQILALEAINPADQNLRDTIVGGVLVVNVNPGSANPIEGQTVAIECRGRTVDEMVLGEPARIRRAHGFVRVLPGYLCPGRPRHAAAKFHLQYLLLARGVAGQVTWDLPRTENGASMPPDR